jgi:hypothetical protein
MGRSKVSPLRTPPNLGSHKRFFRVTLAADGTIQTGHPNFIYPV